jgi:hypothetical protein
MVERYARAMRARDFNLSWFVKASALIVAASAGGWALGVSTGELGPRLISASENSFSSLSLPASLSPSCHIKGNVSQNTGERIYHVPGQEYYDVTVISERYGERWFCSEAEARQAGWRRARR